LDFFFNPRSLAVIGASTTPGKAGFIILKNLLKFGYKGEIYPVNPKGGEVLGLKFYHHISEVPKPVDLAVVVIPRNLVVDAVKECCEAGVRRFIIPAAGFSDDGEEGKLLEKRLVEVASRYGARVMGPNSIGTVNVSSGLVTSFVNLEKPGQGPASLVGQTGLFASAFIQWITSSQNFGLSKVACIGNKCDVDESDVLSYYADDDETGCIGIYLEAVKDGRRFRNAALKALRAGKPVVVVKAGVTEEGAKAASSHTGGLTGNFKVFEGLAKQTGMIIVEDFDQLFTALKSFSFLPTPRGDKLCIITQTGAGGVLSLDVYKRYGLRLARLSEETVRKMRRVFPDWSPVGNPVDMWAAIERSGPDETFSVLINAAMRDPSVDMLLVISVLFKGADFNPSIVVDALDRWGKPLTVCFLGGESLMVNEWSARLEKGGVPTFTSMRDAMLALSVLNKHRLNMLRLRSLQAANPTKQ